MNPCQRTVHPQQARQSACNILGIKPTTGMSELKKAYRRACLKWHPDLNRMDPEANLKFITVNSAYQLLVQHIMRPMPVKQQYSCWTTAENNRSNSHKSRSHLSWWPERFFSFFRPKNHYYTISKRNRTRKGFQDLMFMSILLPVIVSVLLITNFSPGINVPPPVSKQPTIPIQQNLNLTVAPEHLSKLKFMKEPPIPTPWNSDISQPRDVRTKNSYEQGIALFGLGDYQQALNYFKQNLTQNDRFTDVWFWIGLCHSGLAHHQQALDAYKQVIRIQPDYAEAHYWLGIQYGKLGRHRDALQAYRKTVRIQPDDAQARFKLGLTYLALGEEESALEQARLLRELDKQLALELSNYCR